MFITDFTNNSISVYSQGANCNCPAARVIQGAATGMSGPFGIALDAGGTIYVANEVSNTITEYPGASSGNQPPVFAISALANPIGVAVDAANNVYVANSAASGGTQSIQVFGPHSNAPLITISGAATGLSTPGFLALDSGGNIWVANQTGNSVEEFPKLASDPGGNIPPTAVIAGASTMLADPQGLGFDSSGRLYVAINNSTGSFDEVLVYQGALNGNIAPANAICGASTGVNNPTGVAVNSAGTVFVVNSATNVAGYITTFAANNIGNIGCSGPLPNASVGGSNTPLLNPVGIALH